MSTSKEESEQRIGTSVEEKWRLDALIGYTSVAATYRATHRYGNEAALKIIHRSQCEIDGVVERFLQEARLLNRIDHPGVERAFDDGTTDDGCAFLVVELLAGETLELRRVSGGGHLRLGEARPIFDGLFDALIAIHAAGVLHRNLKPGNILLTKDRRVVVTDFGRARLLDDSTTPLLAVDGPAMGSPAFMAPEQARGTSHAFDPRSDIWSLGAILFTVLTGRRVHEGKSMDEKLELARTQPARPIRELLSGVNPALAAVIDRALAFDRLDRWPSVSEMRRAYWLATGRDGRTVPQDKIPKGSAGWTPTRKDEETEEAPVPSLFPPPVSAFLSTEEPEDEIRARERSGCVRVLVTAAIACLVMSLIAGLITIIYFDARPERVPDPSSDAK